MRGSSSVKSFACLLFVALTALGAACGDDHPFVPEDGPGSGSTAATFTDFVVDLVMNHTDDPTPVPYDSFANLPDPDGSANNGSAYGSLFQ